MSDRFECGERVFHFDFRKKIIPYTFFVGRFSRLFPEEVPVFEDLSRCLAPKLDDGAKTGPACRFFNKADI
jgi:hypothetical protein